LSSLVEYSIRVIYLVEKRSQVVGIFEIATSFNTYSSQGDSTGEEVREGF
jgi:hypothetical protein